MKKAVYAGSFDPITMGHIDIVNRISKLYQEVVVLVSQSSEKNYLFTIEERKQMIQHSFTHLSNVNVDVYEGLTVDYVKSVNANVIVRGLRAVVDFEYEMTMANMNKKLNSEIETVLVFASPDYYYISSRGVKEIAKYSGDLKGLVPEHVKAPLLNCYKK